LVIVGFSLLVLLGVGGFAALKAGRSNAKSQSDVGPPLTGGQSSALDAADFRKARFDGTVQGWRIAPERVLRALGISGDLLGMSCAAEEMAPDVSTPLDFTATYLPRGIRGTPSISKVRCGDLTTIVAEHFSLDTPYGDGYLEVTRELMDNRSFAIEAAFDRVSAATLGGKPAVVVEPLHPTGYGQSEIVLIEDDQFDPYAVVVHLVAGNMTLSELERVAKGIQPAAGPSWPSSSGKER
jgi:hypothetical protein